MRETGSGGINAVKQFSGKTFGLAKSVKDKLSDQIAGRMLRRGKDGERPKDQGTP